MNLLEQIEIGVFAAAALFGAAQFGMILDPPSFSLSMGSPSIYTA